MKTEMVWQKGPDGVEYQLAFSGDMSYPTGQRRRKLPNGKFHQFTILDVMPAIDLPPDDEDEVDEVIELSSADIMEDEDDDIIITIALQ